MEEYLCTRAAVGLPPVEVWPLQAFPLTRLPLCSPSVIYNELSKHEGKQSFAFFSLRRMRGFFCFVFILFIYPNLFNRIPAAFFILLKIRRPVRSHQRGSENTPVLFNVSWGVFNDPIKRDQAGKLFKLARSPGWYQHPTDISIVFSGLQVARRGGTGVRL